MMIATAADCASAPLTKTADRAVYRTIPTPHLLEEIDNFRETWTYSVNVRYWLQVALMRAELKRRGAAA